MYHMFVKPLEKLANKLSTHEKDFLFQYILYNRECPDILINSAPTIQKNTNNVNNILINITNKDITRIKKAIKNLDGIKLKFYAINYKLFSNNPTNKQFSVKITTREKEDIFLYL